MFDLGKINGDFDYQLWMVQTPGANPTTIKFTATTPEL
jgi:hypothetical protein